MALTMNLYNYLIKNKPTREHNVTLHHSLPITLRYIKETRKTMKSETASSHRATSNPQSTIHSSFHFHFISENHRQPHGEKKAAPPPTAPRRTSHYKTVRQSHTLHYKQIRMAAYVNFNLVIPLRWGHLQYVVALNLKRTGLTSSIHCKRCQKCAAYKQATMVMHD